MQQGRQQFRFHPLPERKLAHRTVQFFPKFEHLCKRMDTTLGLAWIDAVHRGIHPQGIHGRQVPDQLLAIAHHQGDLLQKAFLAALRQAACDC